MRSPFDDMQILIRPAIPEDAPYWEALRCELWPDGASDHALEIASFFAGTLPEPAGALVALLPAGEMIGFAELSIRTHLPEREGVRAGYGEALYLRPAFRGRGIARQLLQASRRCAGEQKCAAFASDRASRIILDPSF